MSTVTSWLGRTRNSAQLHVLRWPSRVTEKLQLSRAVCGVGPADRTGKSLVTYWPGGAPPPGLRGVLVPAVESARNWAHAGHRLIPGLAGAGIRPVLGSLCGRG